jgi:hypothetical protein
MDAKVRDRFPTLDRATDRIAELEAQLAETRVSKPVASTATPRPPATIPQTPQKPPSPSPKLTVSDLSQSELTEALDLANKSGDSKMVATLYRELQSRRRN